MKSSASKSANITPDISLLKKMASIAGSIPSRLMELIDNSIDAKVPGKPLEVHLKIVKKGTRQCIIIEDNGCGMDEVTSRAFFRLGDSQKLGKQKIGQFGIGSKIAILGIGDTCKVTTKPIEEPYAIDIDFDVKSFKDWNIFYTMKDALPEHHGTKIRIDNLTIRIGDVDRFCNRLTDHFGRTYKHFIESGDVVIKINNRVVSPRQIELLDGYYQEFDFEVDGKRVYGWAGASKEAGINWKFGFDLIANRRIIKTNDMLSRQAHTSLARLVGEIHLDEFPVDIHKTDFIRHDVSFENMQQVLIDQKLSSLLSEISKLTNKEVFSKYEGSMEQMSKSLMKIVKSYDFLRNLDIDEGVLELLKDKSRKERIKRDKKVLQDDEVSLAEIDELLDLLEEQDLPPQEPKEKKERAPRVNIGLVINEPIALSMGSDSPAKRWVIHEEHDGVHLSIEINMDHPVFSKEEEISINVKNVMTESVAEFILREEKKQSNLIEDDVERLNRIKDMLFRHQNA